MLLERACVAMHFLDNASHIAKHAAPIPATTSFTARPTTDLAAAISTVAQTAVASVATIVTANATAIAIASATTTSFSPSPDAAVAVAAAAIVPLDVVPLASSTALAASSALA